MTGIDFDCPCCRTAHRGADGSRQRPWPALAFRRPDAYLALTAQQLRHARADDDLCVIRRAERTDCFVRAVMSLPITGDPLRRLEYGPWVSLGAGDYDDHLAHYDDDGYRAAYAGHLATELPGYRAVSTVPVLVRSQGRFRPVITPDPTMDHPLVRDVHDGITRQEAELRIRSFLLREPMT